MNCKIPCDHARRCECLRRVYSARKSATEPEPGRDPIEAWLGVLAAVLVALAAVFASAVIVLLG